MNRAELLLAWYALIPPLVGGLPDAMASLARWEQLRAFDSAEACEQMTMAYAKRLLDEGDHANFSRAQHVRCVHVSDPRLTNPGGAR